MATTAATIDVMLRADTARYRSEMIAAGRTATRELGGIRKEVASTAQSFETMKRAAVGVLSVQAFRSGIGSLVQAQKSIQAIHYGLLAATGSSAQAADAYSFVAQTAKTLGLDLETSAEGFTKLSAAAQANGVSMAQQQQLFTSFAKASTTLHLSTEKSNSALLAMEQMFSKGKIQAQELRLQLGQAIPGAAVRFQNAVMEMTKGTELAGKSFDQLLQNGELTTSRFLPALVKALDESGRGWEEASHGLNAELNRLSTNWFKLKVDTSSGLFNDAATTSVKLMADNLESLAGAATLAAGVISARLLGKGIAAGADGVGAILSEAKATAALTSARVAESEQAVVAAAIRAREMQQRKALSLQKIQGATTQAELTAATRSYTVAATNAARANATYQASLVGLRNAQVANVAAQRAATVSGGFAGAAASVGRSALALVGGPAGAAVLALGAVALGIANVAREAKEREAQMKQYAKTLEEIGLTAKVAAEDLSSGGSIRDAAQRYRELAIAIKEPQEEIEALRRKIDGLRGREAFRSSGAREGLSLLPEIAKAEQELAALQERIKPTRSQFDALGGELRAKLGPAFDQVRDSVLKMTDVEYGQWLRAQTPEVQAAISQLDKLREAADKARNGITSAIQSIPGQIERVGKSAAEVAALDVRDWIAAESAAGNLTRERAEEMARQGRQYIALKTALDAARKAQEAYKKSIPSATQDAEYTKTFIRNAEARRQEYQFELAAGDNLSEAKRALLKFELELRDTKNASLRANEAYIRKILEENVSLEEQRLARARLIEQKQRELALDRQIADYMDSMRQQHERDLSGITTGGADAVRSGILANVANEFRSRRKDIDRDYQNRLANIPESDIARRNEEQRQYIALLGQTVIAEAAAKDQALSYYAEILAAQADWKNGMATAFADYALMASDVAGQTHDLFTNAFRGAEDAIVEFVKTGKLNFSSLVDSIIADLARIAARRMVSGLAQGLMSALGGLFAPQGTQNYQWAKSSGFGNNYSSFMKGYKEGGRCGNNRKMPPRTDRILWSAAA